jgi:hypothetical protein
MKDTSGPGNTGAWSRFASGEDSLSVARNVRNVSRVWSQICPLRVLSQVRSSVGAGGENDFAWTIASKKPSRLGDRKSSSIPGPSAMLRTTVRTIDSVSYMRSSISSLLVGTRFWLSVTTTSNAPASPPVTVLLFQFRSSGCSELTDVFSSDYAIP